MLPPFPGMDPWLEHSRLWPDVHNRLIAAIGDTLGPLLRPRYFVALEERVYVDDARGLELVGVPDVAVVGGRAGATAPRTAAASAVVDVEVPVPGRVRETYLEVRAAGDGDVVTVIEVLSPANKRPGEGRQLYLRKRSTILATLTSLLEIDLLRPGERMPLVGEAPSTDYAILVSRSWQRPRAHLLPFGVRDPIPPLPVPLREGEPEPSLDLGTILAALYDRAGYDLRIDYGQPPETPLSADDMRWARERLAAAKLAR